MLCAESRGWNTAMFEAALVVVVVALAGLLLGMALRG